MNKATHSGTCQLCGRFQKLPGGRLSSHGYTVQWGFFSGTCPGTGFLPFEISTDRIEAAIERAEVAAASADERAGTLRNDPSPAAVWIARGEYVGRKYVQVWESIDADAVRFDPRESDGRVYFSGTVVDSKNRQHRLDADYHFDRSTAEAFLRGVNERYAAHLDKVAMQHREYAAWQRERIADWKPGELRPIE